MCGFDGVAPLIVPLYLYYATGLCVYVCVCPNPQVLTLHFLFLFFEKDEVVFLCGSGVVPVLGELLRLLLANLLYFSTQCLARYSKNEAGKFPF